MKLSCIQKDVLSYCAEDDMGFWVVVRYVTKDRFGHIQIPPRSEQEKVLIEIRELLETGLIDVWQYNGAEFVKKDGSVSQLLTFIDNEWENLGTMPSGGDVCWFRATPKGVTLARELGLFD